MTEENEDGEQRRKLSRLAKRVSERRKEHPETGEYDPILDADRESDIPVEVEDPDFTDPTECCEGECETSLTDLDNDERMRGTEESGQGNYCPEHYEAAVERGETPRYPSSKEE